MLYYMTVAEYGNYSDKLQLHQRNFQEKQKPWKTNAFSIFNFLTFDHL